jgi:hypothetical protein
MHSRKNRLLWLKLQSPALKARVSGKGQGASSLPSQGLHSKVDRVVSVLTVLQLSEEQFKQLYPAYPGDAAAPSGHVAV